MNDEYEVEITVTIKKNGKTMKSESFSKQVPNKDIIESSDINLTIQDFKYILDNYNFYDRSTHSKSEYWSIDYHVMNDILFNIPRLQNGNSYPSQYSEEASKLHEAGKYTDLSNTDLAVKLWRDELDVLAKLIRLYLLYTDFCYFEKNDLEMQKLYDECKKNNEIPDNGDLVKFRILSQKYWDAWIEKFKEIGQEMWD